MNNSEDNLNKRIRNLERLSFSIILLVASIYAILNAEQTIEKYGNIGVTIYLTMLFISYLFSTIYFINLGKTITEDLSSQVAEFYEIHKPLLSKLKIPLIVIFGVLATKYLFKFEWNIIGGSLTLMLIGYIITISLDKSTWLKDKLGIKYEIKKEEQSELIKFQDE